MKIAVITGASSGMGKEFILQLDRAEAYDEIWVIARRRERLEELETRAKKRILPLDLSRKESYAVYKALLEELFEKGGDPAAIVKERGLAQVSDAGAVEELARRAIEANPKPVAEFKAGKKASLQFLVGQVMKLSRGKADPKLAAQALAKIIEDMPQ